MTEKTWRVKGETEKPVVEKKEGEDKTSRTQPEIEQEQQKFDTVYLDDIIKKHPMVKAAFDRSRDWERQQKINVELAKRLSALESKTPNEEDTQK